MTDVIVVGASSFIGKALYHSLKSRPSLRVRGTYCHTQVSDELLRVDITSYEDIEKLVEQAEEFLVWIAGCKDVRQCEEDRGWAESINFLPVKDLLKAIHQSRKHLKVLFISTDYVFDGQRGAYKANEAVCPVTEYGRSNAEAEDILLQSDTDFKIIRTAAVMGRGGVFFDWLVKALKTEGKLSLFENAVFSPTPLKLLTQTLTDVIEEYDSITESIMHVVGNIPMSRYSFGLMVASLLNSRTMLLPTQVDLNHTLFQRDLSLIPSSYMSRYDGVCMEDRISLELADY